MKNIKNIFSSDFFLWLRRHSATNAIHRTAFDAQTVGVIDAACRGAPDILGAGVRRAHDVTVVATDADTSGRIGHRARDRLGTHLDLQ